MKYREDHIWKYHEEQHCWGVEEVSKVGFVEGLL
jgi:hypothetical protein